MKKPGDAQLYLLARLAVRGWRIKYIGGQYWLVDTRDAKRHQVYERTLRSLAACGWIHPTISGIYNITDAGRQVAPASPRWMP